MNKKRVEKICFIHVPKCGGTSLNEAFKKSISKSLFLKSYKIDSVKTIKRASALGVDYLTVRREILNQKLANQSLRYFTGHAPCSAATRERFDDEWTFVTVLRNPVERLISEYFFNRYKKLNHNKHDLSLEEYLQTDMGKENGYRYIRYFADEGNMNNPEATEEAIENLKKIKLVGILENMQPFARRFEEVIGKPLTMVKNRNKNPISKEEIESRISKEGRRMIIEACKSDILIYETMVKHLRS